MGQSAGCAPPLDTLTLGDCIEVLAQWQPETVDVIFADPPYNLQLRQDLWRPNRTPVDGVRDEWDQFGSFEEYDRFTRAWLAACRRVLKRDGTIWVIGTYHNIHRVGAIMQDLGFWFLNDVVWVKANPMPNFRGVRLTNAHETLIWAARSRSSRHTFNHHAAKAFNGGKQLRSDWYLPLCTGSERLRENGHKLHSTQKPEALLERVITIASRPGDVILDPFLGSGTTAAVAKRLHRHWIGIEKEPAYLDAARGRIEAVMPAPLDDEDVTGTAACSRPRVRFGEIIARGLLHAGDSLYFDGDTARAAMVTSEGTLRLDGREGSIHQLGRILGGGAPCNGWKHWHYRTANGHLAPIDELRDAAR